MKVVKRVLEVVFRSLALVLLKWPSVAGESSAVFSSVFNVLVVAGLVVVVLLLLLFCFVAS